MGYLYHMVPEKMQGDVLYPLNQLQGIFPDIYAEAVKKYDWRLEQMKQEIPPLSCLWNDVLHLSPISPEELKRALEEAGRTGFHRNFFEIDADLIDPQNAAIYLPKSKDGQEAGASYEKYSAERLEAYRKIPASTIEYYKRMISKNEKPLLYAGVPHVFLKQALSIKGMRVVRI